MKITIDISMEELAQLFSAPEQTNKLNKADRVYSHDRDVYDIVLESREEAEEVLSRMDDLMATYGNVSIADMYDLVGIGGNYTDNRYGWTNTRDVRIVRVPEGYKIRLPKPVKLL